MNDPSHQIVDEILVMDCQDGDARALNVLVSRWQKRLWAHAYRTVHDGEAAWDITQDSWLAIVRGLRKLNDPAKFGPWSMQIVANKARDWIRRHKKIAPAPQERQEASADCERVDQDGDLSKILGRLPASHRSILKLHYIEQVSVADIARFLDIPPGTVKSRLHKARAKFKQLWESS